MLIHDDLLGVLPLSVARPWLRDGSVRVVKVSLARPLAPLGFLKRSSGAGVAVERFGTFILNAAKASMAADDDRKTSAVL
jgi:hypothetical protein